MWGRLAIAGPLLAFALAASLGAGATWALGGGVIWPLAGGAVVLVTLALLLLLGPKARP